VGEQSDFNAVIKYYKLGGSMRLKCLVFVIMFFISVPIFAQSVDTAWVSRYNGPGNYDDQVVGSALDDFGNVYVTGWSYDNVFYDCATVKYDPDGDTAWVRRYSGPGNTNDSGHDIVVDDSGNVYVTGPSYDSVTFRDYTTIKYDSAGNELWVRRYNGPGNGDDGPWPMTIDGSGNVCVTGRSNGVGTFSDYATIKYYPNGDTAWVRRYNGPGNGDDSGFDIAVDDSGNVFVTGFSYDSVTFYDCATIKYDSAGNELWVKRYDGPGNGDDDGFVIAVDSSGNVFVTGDSQGSGTYWDYVTIKYVQFLRGDVNNDGEITIADVVYLINYLFRFGPAPIPIPQVGDANCNGNVDISDAVYLIRYLFKGGPPPCI